MVTLHVLKHLYNRTSEQGGQGPRWNVQRKDFFKVFTEEIQSKQPLGKSSLPFNQHRGQKNTTVIAPFEHH